jgi:flagellar biosynthesis/type III secretory pathway chaperone
MPAVQVPGTSPLDDEKGLLIQLELLLEREEELLGARDTAGIAAVAAQREQLIERLGDAARRRRASTRAVPPGADEADLVELYRRLRHRHDVRSQVLRLYADRNATAMRVLAQATGDVGLYQADGSVRMQFVSV